MVFQIRKVLRLDIMVITQKMMSHSMVVTNGADGMVVMRTGMNKDNITGIIVVNTRKTETMESSAIVCSDITTAVTLDQMQTFFGYLGDIVNISLYHFDNSPATNFQQFLYYHMTNLESHQTKKLPQNLALEKLNMLQTLIQKFPPRLSQAQAAHNF